MESCQEAAGPTSNVAYREISTKRCRYSQTTIPRRRSLRSDGWPSIIPRSLDASSTKGMSLRATACVISGSGRRSPRNFVRMRGAHAGYWKTWAVLLSSVTVLPVGRSTSEHPGPMKSCLRSATSTVPASIRYRMTTYGVPDAPRHPHVIDGTGITEFPPSTARLLGRNIPDKWWRLFQAIPVESVETFHTQTSGNRVVSVRVLFSPLGTGPGSAKG